MGNDQQTTDSGLRRVAPPEQSHTPVMRASLGRGLSLRSMSSPTAWAALMAMARQAMHATDDAVYLALSLWPLYRAAAGIGLAARNFLRILAAGTS